jgi:hypothetical protein
MGLLDQACGVKHPTGITGGKALEVIRGREADETVHVPIIFPVAGI